MHYCGLVLAKLRISADENAYTSAHSKAEAIVKSSSWQGTPSAVRSSSWQETASHRPSAGADYVSPRKNTEDSIFTGEDSLNAAVRDAVLQWWDVQVMNIDFAAVHCTGKIQWASDRPNDVAFVQNLAQIGKR